MKAAEILKIRESNMWSFGYSAAGLDKLNTKSDTTFAIALIAENDSITYVSSLKAENVWQFIYANGKDFPFRQSLLNAYALTFCEQNAHRVAQSINDKGYGEAVVFPHKGRKHQPFQPMPVPTEEEIADVCKMKLTQYPDFANEPFRSIYIEHPDAGKKEGFVTTLRAFETLKSWLETPRKFNLGKNRQRAAKFLVDDAEAVALALDKDGHIARVGKPGMGMQYLN